MALNLIIIFHPDSRAWAPLHRDLFIQALEQGSHKSHMPVIRSSLSLGTFNPKPFEKLAASGKLRVRRQNAAVMTNHARTTSMMSLALRIRRSAHHPLFSAGNLCQKLVGSILQLSTLSELEELWTLSAKSRKQTNPGKTNC